MRNLRGRGHGFPFPGDGASMILAESDGKHNGAGFRLAHDDVTVRVLRGGSWDDADVGARAAGRGGLPGFRNDYLGLRLCADWRDA